MLLSSKPSDAAPSVRRLFGIYAAVTLVPVLLLGLALTSLSRSESNARGLASARKDAALLGQSAVAPLLGNVDLRLGMADATKAALARSVSIAIRDQQVLRLRVRDLNGVIVFSDDGSSGPIDPDALKAARGETVSSLSRLDADAHRLGPQVVEVYEPLYAPATTHRIGVLELYVPYAPIAADIARANRRLNTNLTVGLLFLWLCLLAVSVSVTRRLRSQAELNAWLARHDALTSLPNRREFGAACAAAAAEASADRPAAIAVIDLDRFRQVNDTLGHRNADELLQVIGERLSASARPGDVVARLGGDEYGVVLRGVVDAVEAEDLLRALRAAMCAPVEVDALPLAVEASVGFTLTPQDGRDADSLVKQADVAMYVAKREHRGVVRYAAEQQQHDADTLALVGQLGAAIECGQLVLHYQPKVRASTGQITAVEALVRWQHPTRGLLYPDAFLLAAEQTELIEPLTRWVLHEALTALPLFDDNSRLCVAVNVSARSLIRTDLADDILGVLARTGTSPSRLIVEVTETALLVDPVRAAATLRRLAQAGVRVSIDDYGVGQTGLGLLATLPGIAELKIDKSFVMDMESNPRNQAIVRSVVQLGHSLNLSVTAEGVETEAVRDMLDAVQCDLLQGYLFARPLPQQAMVEYLEVARAAADPQPTAAPAIT